MLTIERTNTDIRKLWCLVSNGFMDRRTVLNILDKSDENNLVFSSQYTFNKFKELQFSAAALYKN